MVGEIDNWGLLTQVIKPIVSSVVVQERLAGDGNGMFLKLAAIR